MRKNSGATPRALTIDNFSGGTLVLARSRFPFGNRTSARYVRGMSEPVQLNEQITCDVCGKFGAFEFDGRKLCADCYESSGSCCPEFGRDDEEHLRACRKEGPASPYGEGQP